jgi:hypothetical protein
MMMLHQARSAHFSEYNTEQGAPDVLCMFDIRASHSALYGHFHVLQGRFRRSLSVDLAGDGHPLPLELCQVFMGFVLLVSADHQADRQC